MKNLRAALAGFIVLGMVTIQNAMVASAATASEAASSSTATQTKERVLKQHNPRYQLHKSDSFDVSFTFSPEFNQTVTVGPDGYVTFKEIGSLHVEGETIPQLTETLTKIYSKILHEPVIAISLKDFDKPYFIASGEINKPGKYELREPLTVTQAVAIAGGFNKNSKHSQVVLFHPTQDGVFEAKLLNVKKLLASRNLNEDIRLQPGDLVYVPQNRISKIGRFMPSSAVGAYYNPATNY